MPVHCAIRTRSEAASNARMAPLPRLLTLPLSPGLRGSVIRGARTLPTPTHSLESKASLALAGGRVDDAVFVGVDHRLHSIAEVEFLEDPGHVRLRGCLADDELGADFWV